MKLHIRCQQGTGDVAVSRAYCRYVMVVAALAAAVLLVAAGLVRAVLVAEDVVPAWPS